MTATLAANAQLAQGEFITNSIHSTETEIPMNWCVPRAARSTARCGQKQSTSHRKSSVSKPFKKSVTAIFFQNMGWPVFWGALLTVAFYSLLQSGIVQSPLMQRYFCNHWVQYGEAALFFIGASAICIKALNLIGQFGTLNDVDIVEAPAQGQDVTDARLMLDSLNQLPGYVRRSFLAQRLHDALAYVSRKGTASGLDDELKHLSDMDAARLNDGMALVRIIIWATPMLGFLGTVIGITLALADLSPQALVSTPETAMQGLLSGLAIAFDTTALALILSIVLMFSQYLTNSIGIELLEAVDMRINAELVGRFKLIGTDNDPHLASIEVMSTSVIRSVEQLVQQQVQLWQNSIATAQQTWNESTQLTVRQLEHELSGGLRDAMQHHTRELSHQEELLVERMKQKWQSFHATLERNAECMQDQQAALTRQGDALLQTLDKINHVASLQESLDRNIASLTVVHQLDETVMSLSAAINLLNARLSQAESPRSLRILDETKLGKAA